jgi:hypothetical protein
MPVLRGANLAVRFLLEVGALAALGYWGFQTDLGPIARIGLGIGAPLLAAAAWGLFVSPKARIDASRPVRLFVELAVFGAAVAALYATGHRNLALALGAVYAVNRVLVVAWEQ